MDDLFKRIRAGDKGAVSSLVRENELRIRIYSAKVAPRPDMAEDIAQKAFLIALRNIDRFDAGADFGLWMQGIVRNVARKEWEGLASRSKLDRDGLADYVERLSGDVADSEPKEQRLDALRTCVEKLPDRAREIVKLHYSLGMRCKRVSEQIGTTENAVKMALSRIRGLLRECVAGKLEGA